jgi:hypothetical protein
VGAAKALLLEEGAAEEEVWGVELDGGAEED